MEKNNVFLNYEQVVFMLEQYDWNQKEILQKGLGFEDTRINFFTIDRLENYLKEVRKLANEKEIKITGIQFISAAYPYFSGKQQTAKYQALIYVPTANVNGKDVPIDVVHSTKGNIVTFKEMLAKYGYSWVYNTKEEYEEAKHKELKQQRKEMKSGRNDESGVGNWGTLSPPH